MKIAVFSDVHGNSYACQAVLEAVKKEGDLTAVAVAGDLCFAGSDPARCVDLLQEAGVQAVYGNTDQFIYDPESAPPDIPHIRKWEQIQDQARWAAEKLGPERVAWLESLPFDLAFSPTNEPEDKLLVVHANPKNVHDVILPSVEEQMALKGEVEQPDDDPLLIDLIEEVSARVIAFGHVHYTSSRDWHDYQLVNVAPVSLPTYDGDHRPHYTIFEWRAGRWVVERRYAAYDHAQEHAALLASDMPHKENIAAIFE